ncbi:RbsD/FucU family protein [Qingshengfaniella alkalisoli]|uniref:Fucose-binding protein n=1 Tax=Qingshengfaniella alkalisoli TaxID=2599296 RepID=A0A5B8JB39_9RHOB|nr:RbsD/FucU family protein [Qingshengfaniella alkalisoli]QDY71497.1 fucose-binding protein [Qingshengfaniella alkalisoli]
MLKNIDPRLNADVLHALHLMGHGETVALVDTNFPADGVSRHTSYGKLLRLDNLTSAEAMETVLSVLPLDSPIQPSVGRMQVMGSPNEMPEVQREVQAVLRESEGEDGSLYDIERFAFYEEAKKAYCVIATGERRFYGCFLLTKGVIAPL